MINGFVRIFVTSQKTSIYKRYRRNLIPIPASKITTPSRLLLLIPWIKRNHAVRLIKVNDNRVIINPEIGRSMEVWEINSIPPIMKTDVTTRSCQINWKCLIILLPDKIFQYYIKPCKNTKYSKNSRVYRFFGCSSLIKFCSGPVKEENNSNHLETHAREPDEGFHSRCMIIVLLWILGMVR